MKRFISALLVATMLGTSSAYADSAMPSVPALQKGEAPVGEVISPMKKGQKAPFTGILLSPAAVAKLVVDLQNQQNEANIQIKKAVDTQKAQDQLKIDDLTGQVVYLKTTTDTQLKNRNDEINTLTKRLQESEQSKPNLPIWIGGGAVAGIVLTVVLVVAVNQTKK